MPCGPTLELPKSALPFGFLGIHREHDEGGASEARRLDPRGERLSDVENALRLREGGTAAVEVRQRGVAGCGRDE